MLGPFNPSAIVNEIYDIMEDYEIGVETYAYDVTDAITEYFTNNLKMEYNLCCAEWPNEEGGVCAVAFIDNGHPQLIMFDYKYWERIV